MKLASAVAIARAGNASPTHPSGPARRGHPRRAHLSRYVPGPRLPTAYRWPTRAGGTTARDPPPPVRKTRATTPSISPSITPSIKPSILRRRGRVTRFPWSRPRGPSVPAQAPPARRSRHTSGGPAAPAPTGAGPPARSLACLSPPAVGPSRPASRAPARTPRRARARPPRDRPLAHAARVRGTRARPARAHSFYLDHSAPSQPFFMTLSHINTPGTRELPRIQQSSKPFSMTLFPKTR